jgi:glycine/D-amino acid oxidase-like deaminating enzyme
MHLINKPAHARAVKHARRWCLKGTRGYTRPVDVLIVGAGIFGVTAALELHARGHRVRVIDPGPVPHPLAASTDLSKAVRLEYGADRDYVEMAEAALDGWRRWNHELGATLYHETGVLFLRQTALAPGGFEADSFEVLHARGHAIERMTSSAVRARFPAWNAERYPAGTFSAAGGWVESGRALARLTAEARARGIAVDEGRTFARLLEQGSRVAGAATAEGEECRADRVVVAAGSWTPHVLPFTADWFRSNGMPVFHLKPDDPSLFAPERFPVFGADISTTGYYGFPIHPESGVVKIANHGVGRALHPHSPERAVTAADTAALRAFLAGTFPALAAAPIVYTRVCLYCDTWDGHFWIAPDPAREGLLLATGGSGHAYKFAPVLGALTADAVEGRANPRLQKFRWRPDSRPPRSDEAARRQSGGASSS